MFEIGNSLREARLRQNLELSRAEADTKIRGKYLHALEDERFSVIPGDTYVKGFLRAYAEYLGLDGQLYVDEFNSRFATAEDGAPVTPPPAPPRQLGSRRDSNLVVVALAGIVAVAVLVVVAWKFGSPTPTVQNAPVGVGTGTQPPATTARATTSKQPSARPKATKAKLVVTASRGDCWVRARSRSSTGPLLFEGTLAHGRSLRLARKRLWLRLGAPSVLDVTLDGRRLQNVPSEASTVVVTVKGLRTISSL